MSNYDDQDFLFDNDMNQQVDAHKKTGVLTGVEVSADSGMQVQISSGSVSIAGTKVDYAGGTATITAADSTNPRKDIITIDSSGTITVTAGTPEAAYPVGKTARQTVRPAPPNIPSDEVLLAEIWVGSAVTEITSDNIKDLRILIKKVDGSTLVETDGEMSVGSITADKVSDFDTEVEDNTEVYANTTHRSSDGKDHSDVVLNNSHRASDGKDHSDVVLNNAHRVSDGKDHSDVVLNNAHRVSDGKNHSDVVLNNAHRVSDGTDHANVVLNDAHRGTTTGNPHQVTLEEARSQNNQISGNIDANTNKIENLATPTNDGDAASKEYVDSKIQGLDWQESISSFYDPTSGLPVTPSTGDRYISSATANGWTTNYIYEYNGSSWDETVSNEGQATWVEDLDRVYTFNGSSWVTFGSTVLHNNTSGKQGGTTDEYYHLTDAQHTDLTDSGDSNLHYHSSDRNRSNHTGTQPASTINDFNTEVSNNSDVSLNTTHRNTSSGNPHNVQATEITDFDTEVSNNSDVSANTTHRGTTSGNPHSVTLEETRSENNQLLGDVDANGNTVTGLKAPALDSDAARKVDVDSKADELFTGYTEKTSIVEDDLFIMNDSADSNSIKKIKLRRGMLEMLGISEAVCSWDNTDSSSAITVVGDIEQYIKKIRVVTLSDDGVVNSVLADYNNQTITGTTDGTDGQVMVEFPELWYKETVDGTGHLEKVEISSFALPGYSLHPCFSWGNGRNKIYIGAYEAGHDGTALSSVSGVAPRVSRTLAQFRTEAIARKSGATQNDSNWHTIGFWQQNLIELLFYAYYEDRNSQTELPGYTEASSYSDAYKRNTGRSINLTTHSGSVDADLGGTDSDLSGVLSSGDKIANRFLWIENIFGHIWKFNDGVVYVPTSGVGVSGWTGDFQAVYTTPDPRLWSSTDADIESNYDKLDVTPYAISSDSYIKKVGRGFVPTDGGASSSTYWTDNYWSYLTDVSKSYLRSVISGDSLNDGGRAGVGSRLSNNGLGKSSSSVGSRLCYSQI